MISIKVFDHAGSFAENKDVAAEIRESELRPALARGEAIQINFDGVDGATQSFIHALVSDLIRKVGPSVLEKLEFKKCNPTVRSVIEIVVEYSQLEEPAGNDKQRKKSRLPTRRSNRLSLNRGKTKISKKTKR
jgi:hypothetical protein